MPQPPLLSSKLGKATLGDMKTAIKVLRKLKMEKSEMIFPGLGSPDDWSIEGYGNAGFKSLPDKISSCEGRVVLIKKRKKKEQGWRVLLVGEVGS